MSTRGAGPSTSPPKGGQTPLLRRGGSDPLSRRCSSLDRAHAAPPGPPQRRDHRPCRPWQDHAGRRDAVAVRCVPGQRGRGRPRDGLDGPRAREGHHDPRQEHRGPVRRRQAQHRRHPRPRGLRRRGGARADDGRRRAAAGRRVGRPAPADPLRAAQGAREQAPRDPGGQQGRPARRPHRGSRRRGVRAVHRPRRARGPDRVPDRLHERQGRLGVADGGGFAPTHPRPQAAARPAGRARPGPGVRPGPPAAGPRDQPRREPLPRPARHLPGPARDDPARRERRLVSRRRQRDECARGRAVRHRRARPRPRRRGRPGRDHRRRRHPRGHDRRDADRSRGLPPAPGDHRRRAVAVGHHRPEHLPPRRPRRRQADRAPDQGPPRGRDDRQRLDQSPGDREARYLGGPGPRRAPARRARRADAPRGLRAHGRQAAGRHTQAGTAPSTSPSSG